MAWACAPKFDKAFEEMSEWFKDAGEQKADSKDFASALAYGPLQEGKTTCASSAAYLEDDASKNEFSHSGDVDVAGCIYSTAKAVLHNSHQGFFQQLVRVDPKTPLAKVHDGQSTDSFPLSPPFSSEGGNGSEATTPEREAKTKRRVHPDPVSSCVACLYGTDARLQKHEGKQEKLQETPEKHGMKGHAPAEQRCDKITDGKKPGARSATSYQKGDGDAGRVRLRITPQHFSPLGTTFRDVQVDFNSTSFTIRAVDCAGYAWTAYSNELPGRLAEDRCKFRINPDGTDVTIILYKADSDPWREMTRLELTRPYNQKDVKSASPSSRSSRSMPRFQRNFI